MPKTEGDPLGPAFERRLRGELDRVQPRFSPPRYLSAGNRPLVRRFAPVALAVSVVGILALSAFAATGSPNPVVWTEHVVTVIHPIPSSRTPSSSPHERGDGPAATHGQDGDRRGSPEPSERAEPSEQPSESPERNEGPDRGASPTPSDDHSGEGSSADGGNSGSDGSDDAHEPSLTPSDD
jgi:hypothetical protein